MKKWILPALCLLCLLAACSASGAGIQLAEDPLLKATERLDEADPVPAERPQKEEGAVSYTVDMVNWEKSALGEDGTQLVISSLQLPELTAWRAGGTAILEPAAPEEERAAAVAAAFNERFEEWAAAREFQEYADLAQEHFNMNRAEGLDWTPYTLRMDSSVYQTDRLVSVSATYSAYTGGAHPIPWNLGWNFDLETGSFFDVSILAEDGSAFLMEVKEELIRQANTPREGGYIPARDYWENYEDTMASWSSYAVSFDEAGMTVTFSTYELASYANGPQVFELSYYWLEPHLSQQGSLVLGLEAGEEATSG